MKPTTDKTETPKPVRSTRLLGRRVDGDISALKACIRGLNKSTSPRMLKANLEFLLDRYLWHPSKDLPEHLRPNAELCHRDEPVDASKTQQR